MMLLDGYASANAEFHPLGLGTVAAVFVSKLGVVGHKGKPNEGKHFSEKFPSFIGSAAHLTDKPLFEAATKVLTTFFT